MCLKVEEAETIKTIYEILKLGFEAHLSFQKNDCSILNSEQIIVIWIEELKNRNTELCSELRSLII
jgi:hypothetical protein